MSRYATDNELLTEFETCVSHFNFERVLIVLNALNWENYRDEYNSYKISIMKKQLDLLFHSAITLYHANPSDEIISVESGGFRVNLYVTDENGPGVSIDFIVTSWESYKNID